MQSVMRLSMMNMSSKKMNQRRFSVDRRNTKYTTIEDNSDKSFVGNADPNHVLEDDVVILDDKTFPYLPYDCE